MTFSAKLALWGAVTAFSVGAQASVIVYDNTPLSDPNVGFVAGTSDAADNIIRAMDFKIAGAGTNHVTDVTWWGTYLPTGTVAPTDNFTIAFYADTGANAPQAAPISTQSLTAVRNATGQTTFGSATTPEFKYTASLPTPIDLDGSTEYWISIYNNTGGPNGTNWAWRTVENTQSGLRNDVSRNPQSASPLAWDTTSGSYAEAFQLSTVPEPTSIMLIGLSSLGLMARRRRV